MKSLKHLAGVVLLAQPLFVLAALPYAPSDAEVAQLPKFCAVKFKRPGPDSESQFGRKNWIHMHHYCHGLKFVNRARNYPKDRREYLGRAKGEYQYVFNATEPSFWFRPQMYVEMARIHQQLGERPQAQQRLMDAIQFNPRYEPAYVALIGMLQGESGRAAALELATQGLRYLPTSEALKKAYLDNGGSMPYPEPIQTDNASAASSAEAATSSPEGAAEPAATAEVQSPESAPTSGCRFCPPEEIQQRWRESFDGQE